MQNMFGSAWQSACVVQGVALQMSLTDIQHVRQAPGSVVVVVGGVVVVVGSVVEVVVVGGGPFTAGVQTIATLNFESVRVPNGSVTC